MKFYLVFIFAGLGLFYCCKEGVDSKISNKPVDSSGVDDVLVNKISALKDSLVKLKFEDHTAGHIINIEGDLQIIKRCDGDMEYVFIKKRFVDEKGKKWPVYVPDFYNETNSATTYFYPSNYSEKDTIDGEEVSIPIIAGYKYYDDGHGDIPEPELKPTNDQGECKK